MRLLHRNLHVRRYTLPAESPGGLIIPEAFRGDRTQTLYEVIQAGPCVAVPCQGCRKALEEMEDEWRGTGVELREDDVIVAVGWTAIEVPSAQGSGWIIDARHVQGVHH